MFDAVIDQFLVNFVGEYVDILTRGDFDQRRHFFAGVNRTARVPRRIQNQHLRARGHGVFKIFRPHLPSISLACRDNDWIGPGQSYHIRIAHPIRSRDDHLIARLAGREDGIVTGMFCAIANNDLRRLVIEAVVGSQFF